MRKLNATSIIRLSEKRVGSDGLTYRSLSIPSTVDAAGAVKCSLRDVEITALQNLIVPERYQRNIGTIGIEGQIALLRSRVAIVGLGGLGGSALEMLLRWGIGGLVVIDPDVFSDSNLNRQLLSSSDSLGVLKVEAAKKRALEINAATDITAYAMEADEKNLPEAIKDCAAVVDGLDNIRTRFLLEGVCKNIGIPLVHGAIAGFMGQVSTIFPEDTGLEAVYGSRDVCESGAETELGTPCVTPAAVAAWQTMEVVKILLGWKDTLKNKILLFDLKDQIITIVDLS
ncbi:MAG: HesA/MoeB/ThiF family protein [Candidatus Aminicenantes bacterium]|nr:HesA/MoeB/ThiF family protein [Candidatus Aminicenantes bacterium]